MQSSRDAFTRFWFSEVTVGAMRRNWVRWAARLAQSTFKVTSGNPSDEQHSSNLLARFVSVLELVRAEAPFPIAESLLVNGDRTLPVLDRISVALQERRGSAPGFPAVR